MYCVQYITTTSTAQIFVCIDFHGFSENDTFIDCTLLCSLPLDKYNVLLNIALQWIDNMINQLYNKFQEKLVFKEYCQNYIFDPMMKIQIINHLM